MFISWEIQPHIYKRTGNMIVSGVLLGIIQHFLKRRHQPVVMDSADALAGIETHRCRGIFGT